MYQKKIMFAMVLILSFSLISSSLVNAKTYAEMTSSAEKYYWITGSVLITPVYLPWKILYTGVGLLGSGAVLIGSAGFAHNNALSMAKSSIGGDWYIHPDYLLGNKKLHFFEPSIAPVASSIPVAVPPVSASQPSATPSVAPTQAPAPEATPVPPPPEPAPQTPAATPSVAPTQAPAPETTPSPAPAPAK